jgi:hypothetical protein
MSTENQSVPSWFEYLPGGENSRKQRISSITSCSRFAIIYHIENKLTFTIESLSNIQYSERYITQARALETRANLLLTENQFKYAETLITQSLACALDSGDEKPNDHYFDESELYIESALNENSHFMYLIAAIILTATSFVSPIVFIFLSHNRFLLNMLLGGSFGSLGALVSIIQRFPSIPLPKYATERSILLKSSSRITIGYTFGFIFVIMNAAGLVLSSITVNTAVLCAFSFIVGLSERAFPEIVNAAEAAITNIQVNKIGAPPNQQLKLTK